MTALETKASPLFCSSVRSSSFKVFKYFSTSAEPNVTRARECLFSKLWKRVAYGNEFEGQSIIAPARPRRLGTVPEQMNAGFDAVLKSIVDTEKYFFLLK